MTVIGIAISACSLLTALAAVLAVHSDKTDRREIAAEINSAVRWADSNKIKQQHDYRKTMFPALTKEKRMILLALADCNLNIDAVAKRLYMSPKSVAANMSAIKRETGKDPSTVNGLCSLLLWLKGMEAKHE